MPFLGTLELYEFWEEEMNEKAQLPRKRNCFLLLLSYNILAQTALVHKLQLVGATTVSMYNHNKKKYSHVMNDLI